MKPIAYYDTECYPNFWLLKILDQWNNVYTFSITNNESLSVTDRQRIYTIFELFTVISFNGINYDVPMIGGALVGYTPSQLKALNDRIIVDKVKHWELGVSDWKPSDHIDVMEVAPAQGSQKQYAGRIHCKKMQDLPYDPATVLTTEQIREVSDYCLNDLEVLRALYQALQPQIELRYALTERYGIELRSKSDAQVAEAVIKLRCEQVLGRRIYKPDIDWNMTFKYNVPSYIGFTIPQLQHALRLVTDATFRLGANGSVVMPPALDELVIPINDSAYRMGIGGLHSSEKSVSHYADDNTVIQDRDVASYYPSLILNSGKVPPALGVTFAKIYAEIKTERIEAKRLQGQIKDKTSQEYIAAKTANDAGKIFLNGSFGKTGSPYSILVAYEMLIQTTITGQLSLLMLIEWLETYGIPVISANTDGIVIKVPKDKLYIVDYLVSEWEKRTTLEMETTEYRSIHSRDVNSYFAVKTNGEVKRKGEYAEAGMSKNPDVEICSDAVAEYLAHGTPIHETILACRDIRKFITIQRVNGGGIKMWGVCAEKTTLVRDMTPILTEHGWYKDGRKWRRNDVITDARSAYETCFPPQRAEFLGKVVRWYYGLNCEGSIVYASNGNTVGNSYGSKPCMTLPDEFPDDIDYEWYLRKCNEILIDINANN
jgi:hypothetical protein